MATNTPGLLPTEEYERRKTFLASLKTLTRAEHIEILRILQANNVPFSENQNGVFFNVGLLTQPAFDALELFMKFTHSNRKNLADRENFISSLSHTTSFP
jgi:hypothetical protein